MDVSKGKELTGNLLNKARELWAEKRRPLVFVFGGLGLLVLILVIGSSLGNSRRAGRSPAPNVTIGPGIPAEELLIPAEPDFLPEYLLEREPRPYWTLGDIDPYWRTLEDSEEWRRQIRASVNALLEDVP